LAEAKVKGKVEYNWELDAVLNEVARTTPALKPGRYIVEICW
jgi:hypothetical protein